MSNARILCHLPLPSSRLLVPRSVFRIDRLLTVFVDPILVRDPMDENNNVGRNCFRFSQIQDLFWNTYCKLMDLANSPTPPEAVHGDSFWFFRTLFPSIATEMPK